MTLESSKKANIHIDAGRWLGELSHNWNYIGYDEINYTYIPEGQELLARTIRDRFSACDRLLRRACEAMRYKRVQRVPNSVDAPKRRRHRHRLLEGPARNEVRLPS